MNQLLIQHCKATTLQDFLKIIFKKERGKKKTNSGQAEPPGLGHIGKFIAKGSRRLPSAAFPQGQ